MVIFISILPSQWKLVLTNETDNDVIFISDYCLNSKSKLIVRKKSTEYFYCSDPLICSESEKKICVENIGCYVYSHSSCSGYLGSLGNSAYNIKLSTSNLIYDTESQWAKRINESTNQEILSLLKQRDKNLYLNDGILKYVNDSQKKNKEIVLAAIEYSSSELHYSDKSLREDRSFILELVKKYRFILSHINDAYKKDKEIVVAAYKLRVDSFFYADDALKNDKKFILTALKDGYFIFENVGRNLKMDRSFILEASELDPRVLTHLIERDFYYRDDKEIVLLAIRNSPSVLRHASIELRNNKEFVIKAIKANKDVFYNLEADFKTDSDILKLIE